MAVGGQGGRARQEGPAEAVDPGSGSRAAAAASAAGDGGLRGGAEGSEDAAGGDIAGGSDASGGESEGGDVEEGEYCAAVADADMQCDLDRQWKQVQASLQKAELLAAEKARVEARHRQVEGLERFLDRDLEERLRQAAADAQEAARKCDVEAMRQRLDRTHQELQATRPPPGVASARGGAPGGEGDGRGGGGGGGGGAGGGDGRRVLRVVVPTGTEPVSMFSPAFWSAFDPVAFPYGDGVFGLERDTRLTYPEWCRCLMAREELEYEVGEEHPAAEAATARSVASESPVPRWRRHPDLLTAQYCLWRRKAIIQGARHFVRTQRFSEGIGALANLKSEELVEAVAVLGKGAGLKEALTSEAVTANVKSALRSMLLSNASVVGSDAHRTALRHMSASYCRLFGPPLVFTTPNVADTRNVMVSLMYQGVELAGWRLLEDNAPAMPSTEEMLRRVAADPVAQATVTNLMLELFLEHVVGVLPGGVGAGVSDGVAGTGAVGAFGVVRAYFGPVESQGRGGIHPHIHLWLLHPMTSRFLARLREGDVEDLEELLRRWRAGVLARVGSVQFDAAEEVGRQLGLEGQERLPPLPLSDRDRARAYADGRLEEDDLAVEVRSFANASRLRLEKLCKKRQEQGRVGVPRVWEVRDGQRVKKEVGALRAEVARFEGVDLEREKETLHAVPVPQGPRRQRPFAPLAPPEPEPHEEGAAYPASRRVPLTGAHATLQPQYRRKPPYRTHEDGSAAMHFADDPAAEARSWARCFARDARRCFIQSHLHRCKPTCWKLSKGDEPKNCRVCRLGFFHEYETAVYSHPARKQPASSVVFRRLRAGKDLVLPEGARIGFDPTDAGPNPAGASLILDDVPAGGYGPWVHRGERYGRAGRVDVVRYHPYHGSTNPCGQVCLRCNLDVQCLDRVVSSLPGDEAVGFARRPQDLTAEPAPVGAEGGGVGDLVGEVAPGASEGGGELAGGGAVAVEGCPPEFPAFSLSRSSGRCAARQRSLSRPSWKRSGRK